MADPAANPPLPHKEPSDAEEVYFHGSPMLRGLGMKELLWPLAGLLLIAMPFVMHRFSIRLPIAAWAGFFVIGLCLPFVPAVKSRSVRYRVTNYRIDYERGLLSKDIDTLELWHVEDLRLHQSLLDRLLGVGTISITSRDERLPALTLVGIPEPRQLYETLKQRVIAVKRSRGVIKVDPG